MNERILSGFPINVLFPVVMTRYRIFAQTFRKNNPRQNSQKDLPKRRHSTTIFLGQTLTADISKNVPTLKTPESLRAAIKIFTSSSFQLYELTKKPVHPLFIR